MTVKILPPAVPGSVVHRPALEARLDEVLDRRVAVAVAGPGFGKSTLLATWATRRGWAWYEVGAEDADAASLARGLVEALRVRRPGLPADLVTALERARGPSEDERTRAEALAALVSEALEEVGGEPLVLVLDDLQELGPDAPSVRLVDALVRQAPPTLHLVLSSRSEPPFPLERLKGRGQVLEIDAGLLAFSREEVAAVLELTLRESAEGLADVVYGVTGGWPAAVRLAAEALRSAPPAERPRTLDRLRRPEGPLFAYLAEEVFGPQAANVRDFLRRVTPFDRFGEELCTALGVGGAATTLRDLVRRGLFVQVEAATEGWFTLHGLVRDFVRESWPLRAEELEDVHRRAAAWFQAHGYPEDALASAAAAGDQRTLARLLVSRGPELLASGRVESVLAAVDALRDEHRSPQIELLTGQARQVRGDWDGALACFERAGGAQRTLPAAIAWRIGLVHYLRGALDEALAVYERGRTDGGEPQETAMLLAWTATVRWVRGELEASRDLADRALALASSADDDRAAAAAHTVLAMLGSVGGDPAAEDRHDALALEHAERARDVLQVIRIRANRGGHLAERSKHEEALRELDEAIRLAELTGFANFHALALVNRGGAWIRLGRLDEALGDLEAARALYERLGSGALCYTLGELGELHRERGEVALARAAYAEATAVAERSGDLQGLVSSLAGQARVLAAEDPESAWPLAERALSFGPGFYRLSALAAAGWVALARGNRELARSTAAEAVELASSRRDRAGLAEAIELTVVAAPEPETTAGRLEEAIAIWEEIGSAVGAARARLALARLLPDRASQARASLAERQLRRLGVRTRPPLPAGLLAALPRRDPPAIAVRTLGGFELARAGAPVTPTEWQSKKARDLLKLLVARRGRPAPRDALMEALWPEEDPAPLANRLSVALATVRAVLDPERRNPADHFVAATRDGVALRLANVVLDLEDFHADAEAGLALLREGRPEEAIELLEAAEDAYTGDFLEEDAYAEWAEPARDEARATYAAVASALARTAAARGDHEASVRYRLRILERDPHDEPAHLELVSTLAAAGRHGEARRAYRGYVARMEELGVEPAPFPGA